ncbi:guanylate kinase [Povalibacter uvarum]|uniref:Guanylate kinase n=1 Tax=Povalibacter uvarum TaxID=732238 RepID=A0A841HLF7_9GAMM|nr:ATP-binding protein [Povalibacter uvarum]MBB6093038.1 guanylate kinase [Povalibacter uvarum]
MDIDNLNPECGREDRRSLSAGLSFHHELYDLGDTVLKTRAIRALENVAARYPICRSVRCATRRKVEDVFDDLALHMGMTALRMDEGTLLLDGPGVFVQAEGRRKAEYCSCSFGIWAESKARADEVRDTLFRLVGERYSPSQMFTIDWHFMNSRSGLSSASFDELAVEPIYDEAYPTLREPVQNFIRRYLDASETVLILLGPPGTGKTRLVRAILGEMSKRRHKSANVMYTGDKRALENDEIFVDFITGSHDAFVIEDADHLLLARNNGNHDLHRFLAIADGVVRAQGRKIIFTTNLPNVSDIDEALLRPGRCFATVRTRGLSGPETSALLTRLARDEVHREAVLAKVMPAGTPSVSIATVYRASATLEA